MVLKPTNKYQIIRPSHKLKHSYRLFPASTVSLSTKKKKQIENMRILTVQTFTIGFTLVPEEHFEKLYSARKFDLSCSIEMYHFKKSVILELRNRVTQNDVTLRVPNSENFKINFSFELLTRLHKILN